MSVSGKRCPLCQTRPGYNQPGRVLVEWCTNCQRQMCERHIHAVGDKWYCSRCKRQEAKALPVVQGVAHA